MKFKNNFKVYAPATIANFALCDNQMSLAIDALQDEIIVRQSDLAGINISSITNNKTKITLDVDKNTAGVSAKLVYKYLVENNLIDADMGINLELRKKIPLGYGLGSSIASACAAAVATNLAFGNQLDKRTLIAFINESIQLINNKNRLSSIAACLMGGMTIAGNNIKYGYSRLPLPRGLQYSLGIPKIKKEQFLSTFGLDKNIINKVSISNANSALLVQALYTNNLDLMQACLKSSRSYPQNSALNDILNTIYIEANVLQCDFLKGNAAIGALCKNTIDAEQAEKIMNAFFESHQLKHQTLITSISQDGCKST